MIQFTDAKYFETLLFNIENDEDNHISQFNKTMLFSKDENIKTSAVYIGSLILEQLKKERKNRITIFEIAKNLQKRGIISYRQIVFALMFLYSCKIIDFKEPYIYVL